MHGDRWLSNFGLEFTKYCKTAFMLVCSYLTLALPFQIHDTHVHYGTQVSEGLHHSHI